MKDVVLKAENKRKVFTKEKGNSRININYNPLKVNYRLIYKRRDGLHMEKGILKEIKAILNFKEKIFACLLRKTFIKVYKKGIEKGFNSKMWKSNAISKAIARCC